MENLPKPKYLFKNKETQSKGTQGRSDRLWTNLRIITLKQLPVKEGAPTLTASFWTRPNSGPSLLFSYKQQWTPEDLYPSGLLVSQVQQQSTQWLQINITDASINSLTAPSFHTASWLLPQRRTFPLHSLLNVTPHKVFAKRTGHDEYSAVWIFGLSDVWPVSVERWRTFPLLTLKINN